MNNINNYRKKGAVVCEVLYLSCMNFLAHLYLSGDDAEIKVGNFIGDFVRGKNLEERFGKGIARGISLHREIDWFTDRHLVVKQSKERLRSKYHHYASVIVDIFYDHFLAKNFDRYSGIILPDFADACYATIQHHNPILPEQVKYMMPYMINGNWLANYAKIDGIHRALGGTSRRTKFESKMEEASEDLKMYYGDFEKEFLSFFPELQQFAGNWLST